MKIDQIKVKSRETKSEFLDFLKKYNVIELAIGVVLGGAAKDLVNSLANDIIMPVIGMLTPSGSWREIVITVAGSDFKVGNLMGSVLNFLIVAIVVFVVVKKLLKIENVESNKTK